jgi:deoxyribose-phosphate aldolase
MKILKNYSDFINENINTNEIEQYLNKIDYTNLEPSATKDDIDNLCQIAAEYKLFSVCILPNMVKTGRQFLDIYNKENNSDVKVCTVISFPDGDNTLEEKYSETQQALADGADEIDMVFDYKRLNDENANIDEVYKYLVKDVSQLAKLVHSKGKLLKVIVESGLLSEEDTDIATHVCLDSGADFIKTSTGKVSVGAELNKVKIMRNIIIEKKSNMKIKASGGIRTIEDIRKFNVLVDRFGIGFKAVNNMLGLTEEKSNY